MVLARLGPIPLNMTTVVRKTLSVVLSIVLFGHTISLQKGAGIVIVMAGVFLETWSSMQEKKSDDHAKDNKKNK